MSPKAGISAREYWEQNIERFGRVYYDSSEEHLIGNRAVVSIYRRLLFPIEKAYMRRRHRLVTAYITANVRDTDTVVDIGCGDGIYTERLVRLARSVHALDLTDKAIELTRQRISEEYRERVSFARRDVCEAPIPRCDVALAMGVVPYIASFADFADHTLPFTNKIALNYLDRRNLLNRLRRRLTSLDVRNYSYHDPRDVEAAFARHGFRIIERAGIASGWFVAAERIPSCAP